MSIESVSGRVYGPFSFATARSGVAAYVSATGDDPARWTGAAPRSLAGSMLFAVAPNFLGDATVAPVARSVIHGEQTFTWHREIPLDEELSVTGIVTRVRERDGVFFVGFDLNVTSGERTVVSGSSLFLMSGTGSPAGSSDVQPEPAPDEGSLLAPSTAVGAAVDEIPGLVRSASRSDLVRYAGASRDFNPIHWDHEAAVAAGLPGVVVHGLLQSSWLTQAVERCGLSPVTAKFRYRAPLRPAVAVTAGGSRSGDGCRTALVSAEGVEHVAGTFTLAG